MRPHVRLLLRLLAVGIAGALGGVIWLKAFDSGQGGQPARAAVLPAAAVGGPLVPTADTVDPPAASSASLRARITIPVLGEQKVRFLLGPYGSSATATDAAVAEQTHVPFVSTNGAAQAIYSQRYPYVFGVLSPASKYLQGVLDMAASMAPKPTTMAILSADDSSSVEVAKSVLDYAPRVGMQVVDNKRYPNGSTNLYAQLAEAKQKKPDIVLNSGHLVEAIAINKAAKDLRLGSKIYAYSVGPATPDFTQALGNDANLVFSGSQWSAQVKYRPVMPISAPDYVQAYQQKFGT